MLDAVREEPVDWWLNVKLNALRFWTARRSRLEACVRELLETDALTNDERRDLQIDLDSLQASRNLGSVLVVNVGSRNIIKGVERDVATVWTRVHGTPPPF